jgi:chemotaxis protein MotB
MSRLSPTLLERIEKARQAHQAHVRAQKAQPGGARRRSDGQHAQANRFGRWHVEDRGEQDNEVWLLSYLDLLTLLVAMLVVMLGLMRVYGPSLGSVQTSGHIVHGLAVRAAPASPYPAVEALVPPEWANLSEPAPEADETQLNEAHVAQAADHAAAETAEHATAEVAVAAAVEPAAPSVPAPAPLTVPSKESLGLADLDKGVDVIINEQSVSFRISNELLFPSGSANLSPTGLSVIKNLARILKQNNYPVSVEGHSDPKPIQTRQFPSNWELSSSRAASVLRELTREGVAPERLRAVGYADTRPIQPNDTPAGRAANRRVELIMDIAAPA